VIEEGGNGEKNLSYLSSNMEDMFNRMVEDAKEHYEDYYVSLELANPEGWEQTIALPFHWVGRNATHGFGIALLDDGRIAKLGRMIWTHWADDYQRDWCEVFDHGDLPGYLGRHY